LLFVNNCVRFWYCFWFSNAGHRLWRDSIYFDFWRLWFLFPLEREIIGMGVLRWYELYYFPNIDRKNSRKRNCLGSKTSRPKWSDTTRRNVRSVFLARVLYEYCIRLIFLKKQVPIPFNSDKNVKRRRKTVRIAWQILFRFFTRHINTPPRLQRAYL